ncbi:MAG: hypothetical protein ACQKBW_04940, partial [Puniceicoccales bacterium]
MCASLALTSFPFSARAADDGFADIASWRQYHFGTEANSGDAANTADPDHDGVPNIVEYALGMNPRGKDTSGRPAVGVTVHGLSLTYNRVRTDIDYVVEGTSNFATWGTAGVNQGGSELGTATASAAFGDAMALRLKVLQSVNSVTGLRETAEDALEFVVNTSGVADLTFAINGGSSVTVRMTQSDGMNSYTVTGLSAGDSITYAFNYETDGETVESGGLTYAFSGDFNAYTFTPLYNTETELEPELQVETDEALYTYFADRARDRHAREDQFQDYDHYLSHYWIHRTAQIEIIDTIGKGGNTITFNVQTEWKLKEGQAEARGFYRGIGTVAEYYDNMSMTPIDDLHYTRVFNYNQKEGRPIQVGDRLEFEISQFLDNAPEGRDNYYGTTYLYIVGQGLVPWDTRGVFGDPTT